MLSCKQDGMFCVCVPVLLMFACDNCVIHVQVACCITDMKARGQTGGGEDGSDSDCGGESLDNKAQNRVTQHLQKLQY